jgi:hypothetical protein
MAEDGMNLVERFWTEVFTGGDLDLIDDLFAPDFTLYDLALRTKATREDVKSIINQVRQAIDGVEATVEEQLISGDRVATRLTLRCRNRKQSLAPPTAETGGYEVDVTTRASGAAEFTVRIKPSGATSSSGGTRQMPPSYQPSPGSEGEILEFSGMGISRIAYGQIQEAWFLWEELRARYEIVPGPKEWRWPPWSW